MSDKSHKLSEFEIRELFHKYEVNKNNQIDQNELSKLVRDVYLKNHNIKDVNDLTQNDQHIINRSVQELLKSRDHGRALPLEDFVSYHHGQNSSESAGDIFDQHRGLVYGGRIARGIQGLGSLMVGSRPLAYASELGESARPLIHPNFVRSLYGISWGYVLLDTFFKSVSVSDQGKGKMGLYAVDLAIWHTFASMLLPAFTIHSIVKFSGILLKDLKLASAGSKMARFGPSFLGLAAIPLIIHPIDHATDVAMDNTLRRFYSHKLPVVPKIHH